MKPGAVLVDISIDQGGCFETSQPTTHADPTFVVDGVIHYCVANMPGAVPRTSTFALTNATLPYVRALADLGWQAALKRDAGLAAGLNVHAGEITHEVVAQALGLKARPAPDGRYARSARRRARLEAGLPQREVAVIGAPAASLRDPSNSPRRFPRMKICAAGRDADARRGRRAGRSRDLPGRPRRTPTRASRPITSAACRCGAASSTRPPARSSSTRTRARGTVDITVDTALDRLRQSEAQRACQVGRHVRRREVSDRDLQGHAREVQGRRAHRRCEGQFTLHGVTKPLTLTINQFLCKQNPDDQEGTLRRGCLRDLQPHRLRHRLRRKYGFKMDVKLAIQVEAVRAS